jgi:hypothetical protein
MSNVIKFGKGGVVFFLSCIYLLDKIYITHSFRERRRRSFFFQARWSFENRYESVEKKSSFNLFIRISIHDIASVSGRA